MRIVKYGHACLEIIEGDRRLILDPGVYSEHMNDKHNVDVVLITHQHDDHCYEEQLDRIVALNPDVKIFCPDDVRDRLAKAPNASSYRVTVVHHGDLHQVGPFKIEFFGAMHAEIHRSIPLIQNTGVFINDTLYYPGDSFTRPDRPVPLLACPSSAPWLKISEVMDFVDEVKPARCFPTHNIHLSEFGHQLNNGRIQAVAESHGGKFEYILAGEHLDA
jgi:L-ascorbate metabolism protein UlaG (beta-lactamase superfamily)